MTFREVYHLFVEHNAKCNIDTQFGDPNPLFACVVFDKNNFDKEYSETKRTYKFRSDNKYFIPKMLGSSIFAECLDKSEEIRLDYYLDDWEIENCYLVVK